MTLINKKIGCLHDKVRTTDLITTTFGSFIPLVMLITLLDFGEFMLETFIRGQIDNLVYVKQFWSHLRNGWSVWCETNTSVGFWVYYVMSPFDHTHDLDLQVSISHLEIFISQKWVGRWALKEKICELSIHDHDIGFCVTMMSESSW